MSARKSSKLLYLIAAICLLPLAAASAATLTLPSTATPPMPTITHASLAQQLGWVESNENQCGGYYLESPFTYPVSVGKNNSIEITSNQTLFSGHGTSTLEGKVTVTRHGQQLTANKAYLYRDPVTGKMTSMELIGDVNLREPNTLIVGKTGRYNFVTKTKSLADILYRTSLNGRDVVGPKIPEQEMQLERKITAMTAWGKAYEFSSTEPKIYELSRSSFSTCPPTNPAWRVKASHIVLNKNTGRGYATNARILVKDIPVFYFPYIDFSIDHQRKSGFLWPTFGGSNKWGPYFYAPFYWNMAPNYDMTITPGLLTKRGVQLSDNFRYLTQYGRGDLNVSILPNDREFANFQVASEEEFASSTVQTTQAELIRLMNASTTRKSLVWHDATRFNDHWSSQVNFNYVGDDYYMHDFGSNVSDLTQNQLLQEADLYYKGPNWNFISRLQTYQTLHPINETPVTNQYRRFPQLILNGDYPDQPLGLEYFIGNDLSHFDIRNTPGTPANQPIGNRINTQPGVSLPLYTPYAYINPRVQVALTGYNLYQTADTATPTSIRRAIPIFDLATGLSFSRDTALFSQAYQQTLEPQAYYTYIPYHNQSEIPLFDTTINTLTYDQLFSYNRFSGLDRIGDANQVGVGVTTRLINQESGEEKVRLGVGEIVYFANRLVTLCTTTTCPTTPPDHSNYQRLSPISGVFNYNINPAWTFATNVIWNPVSKQLDNSTIGFHYQPTPERIINMGYTYVHSGDPLSGIPVTDSSNNLKVTDFSVSWPVLRDINAVGRWSENWNHVHLQNLLYGLQYDSCCWAVRMVGGRAFTGLDSTNNNQPLYTSEFYIQFALKGLGNIGNENTGKMLSSVNGYNTHFGQEF